MSLFKDGIMRTTQKSVLKPYLRSGNPAVSIPETTRIADGGGLLWCCDWKRDETFSVIFQRYAVFLTNHNIDTIVFDGYSLSTKDSTHQKRSGPVSQEVEIKEANPCPANRKTFLGNYHNKERFIACLAGYLKERNFKVVECPSDADTTIVKEALNAAKDSSVVIYSDDTDILCLLLHHIAKDPSLKEIFMVDMTKKKGKQRECYNVSEILQSNTRIGDFILFGHAFTGCDTTSAIHNFGKTSIFDKIESSTEIQSLVGEFYKENSPEKIGEVTIRLFELLHSPTETLPTIRKKKYEQIVLSNRAVIDPSMLPPSPRAAYYHGLRVYHQLKVWRELRNTDYMPLTWGCQMVAESFTPIMTDIKLVPQIY